MNLQEFKTAQLPAIEEVLTKFLWEQRNHYGMNAEMAAYQLSSGGKRIRALIPVLIGQALEKDLANFRTIGCAMELIHNATLVHDDIQDGDELRRGEPTVWKRYSVPQAINCGNTLFQMANIMLARIEAEPATVVEIMQTAAIYTTHVIEGQAQEFLMNAEFMPDMKSYLDVVRGKTSGLLVAPTLCALHLAGASHSTRLTLADAVNELGVIFQMKDDLLDIYGNKGRDQVASDIAEGKVSALVVHINERASEADRTTLSEILRKSRQETTARDIESALSIFEKYDAKASVEAMIRKHTENAFATAGKDPVSQKLLPLLFDLIF